MHQRNLNSGVRFHSSRLARELSFTTSPLLQLLVPALRFAYCRFQKWVLGVECK
jgi:hypothetical protein